MTDALGEVGESQLPWPRRLLEIESRKYLVYAGPARMNKEEREANARADRAVECLPDPATIIMHALSRTR